MRKKTKKTIVIISAIITVTVIAAVIISVRCFTITPGVSTEERLKSVPYLTWMPAGDTVDKSGVTRYVKDKVFNGVNIYNSRNLPAAFLIDMYGNVLHKWTFKVSEDDSWHHVEMDKNGDLLAIVKDKMLIRMGWNSEVKWLKDMRFHHDIAISENNDIYSIIRNKEKIVRPEFSFPLYVLNDYIVVLSSEGEIKKQISIYKLLKNEMPLEKFIRISQWMSEDENAKRMLEDEGNSQYILKQGTPADIFHTNNVEVIDRDIEGLCKKGDILFSVRELDLIGILDIKREELIWKWGPGELDKQHHPTLLENGNILIFDNGVSRGFSRVLELNPITKEIVWEYKTDPPQRFFSLRRGSSQRLPDGNTLITESDKGRVIEVTDNGTVVWEFYNPQIDREEKKRAAIYRLMRIIDSDDYPCIRKLDNVI